MRYFLSFFIYLIFAVCVAIAEECTPDRTNDLIAVSSETGFVLQSGQDALVVFEPVKSGVFDVTIRLTPKDVSLLGSSDFDCEKFTHKRHDWVTTKCDAQNMIMTEQSISKLILNDQTLANVFAEIGINNPGGLDLTAPAEAKLFPAQRRLNLEWVKNMASIAKACFLWHEARNTPLPNIKRKHCRDAQGTQAVLEAKIVAAAKIAAAKAESSAKIAEAKAESSARIAAAKAESSARIAEAKAETARIQKINEILGRWLD